VQRINAPRSRPRKKTAVREAKSSPPARPPVHGGASFLATLTIGQRRCEGKERLPQLRPVDRIEYERGRPIRQAQIPTRRSNRTEDGIRAVNKTADIDALHPVTSRTHLCFGHRQDQRHRADQKTPRFCTSASASRHGCDGAALFIAAVLTIGVDSSGIMSRWPGDSTSSFCLVDRHGHAAR